MAELEFGDSKFGNCKGLLNSIRVSVLMRLHSVSAAV